MLLTKIVKMKWHTNNKKWYEAKGYKFTKYKDEFEVKVEDLSRGSNAKVQIKCDNPTCKSPYLSMKWVNYKMQVQENKKYYCIHCFRKIYGAKIKEKEIIKKKQSFGDYLVNNYGEKGIEIYWDWENNNKLNLNPWKIAKASNKKAYLKCPECGRSKFMTIDMFYTRKKVTCICNDKVSYPEKIMYSILNQLNIDFIYQLTKKKSKWCNKYRYDFYFKINNKKYIIETHGMGHYEIGFQTIVKSKRARTLEQEQENDRLKKELALKNGIKEDNYIIIDCRYSILNWIKNHISKSELNNIFDLSKINWLECHRYACSSLVKKVCDLWNNGIHNITKISEIMKLCNNTIIKYLQQGKELELCNYDKKYTTNIGSSKKVICLNNNKIFKTIKQAGIYMKLKSYSIISACCRGKLKSAGKDPITGKKLR